MFDLVLPSAGDHSAGAGGAGQPPPGQVQRRLPRLLLPPPAGERQPRPRKQEDAHLPEGRRLLRPGEPADRHHGERRRL